LALALALAGPPRAGAADASRVFTDGLLAVVGTALITVRDVTAATQTGEDQLAQRLQVAGPVGDQQLAAAKDEVLKYRVAVARELIRRQVTYAEFLRRGYQLPAAVLDEELANRTERLAGGDDGRFRQWLRERETTMAEYRDELQKDVAAAMLIQREVDSHVLIAPREMAAYYAAHQARFGLPATYELQLLELKGAGLDATALQLKVDAVNQALQGGLDFTAAVKQFSDGAAKAAGGVLPATAETELNDAFHAALAGLQEGQHSQPFQAGKSTCWLYVRQLTPGRLRPFAEVSGQVRGELLQAEKNRRYERYINELRHKTYVRTVGLEE
jgi:peptidyl-prolyl cis-trans isomerase SurA